MRGRWTILALAACAAMMGANCSILAKGPGDEDIQKMREAVPEKPIVKPAKEHKMLIFTLCKGFRHSSIPYCTKALEIMGQASGVYTTVASDDPKVFAPDSLKRFDLVCFNNTTGNLFDDETLKKSLMDWVKAGGGVVGVHAATDVGGWKWPEFKQMMGGVFSGHPWHEDVGIKVDDPDHPIAKVLGGEGFIVKDEIYQFNKGFYSRENLRVLLSLDMTCTSKKGKRDDQDYGVSWIRDWGKGRMFYCSLGHRHEIFWNPKVMRFYLAGIQWAAGDLKGDATPSAKLSPQPKAARVPASAKKKADAGPLRLRTFAAPKDEGQWITLFDGDKEDLQKHWGSGRDGDIPKGWSVKDGALAAAGKGPMIWTKEEFGDFVLDLEFKTTGNSGVFFRTGNPGNPVQTGFEMQVLNSGGQKNPGKHSCGAVYDALAPTANPMKNDEWNRAVITCRDNTIRIEMNGTPIIDMDLNKWNTPRKNPDGSKNKYKTALKDFPREGHIGFQQHGHPVLFRNIRVKPLKDEK
ncbi:MAG: ThuA domain-containing protein [Phycisphaerae bacterium]